MTTKHPGVSRDEVIRWLHDANIEVTPDQLETLTSAVNSPKSDMSLLPDSEPLPSWFCDRPEVNEALSRVNLARADGLIMLGIEHKPFPGQYRLRCPECGQFSIPYRPNSTGGSCESGSGCAPSVHLGDLILQSSLSSEALLARLRNVAMHLSEQSGIPILGYQPLNNGYHQCEVFLPPIVKVCRRAASNHVFAIRMAAEDFGLSEWAMASARLGFYASADVVLADLIDVGASEAMAHDFGWLSDAVNDSNSMSNLVVCFLNGLTGSVPALWGYRPASLRRSSEKEDQYVVGQSAQPDSLFLYDILGSQTLIFVEGFMHALALREDGFNAVGAPLPCQVDFTIWRDLAARGHTTIVAAMTREKLAEVSLAEANAAKHGITIRWVEPTPDIGLMRSRVAVLLGTAVG